MEPKKVTENIFCAQCGALVVGEGFISPYGSTKFYCINNHETLIVNINPKDDNSIKSNKIPK